MRIVGKVDAVAAENSSTLPYTVETPYERYHADDLAELVDLFVDHYMYPPPEHAPELYHFLVMTQTLLEEASVYQRKLIAQNPVDALDPFYGSVLYSSKAMPFTGKVKDDCELDMEWRYETPLILMRTDYQPHTSRELPTGNIIFIDPSSEYSFLRSLELLNVCRFIDRTKERLDQ